MTREEEATLEDHIPYRLAHVDGMRWACELLLPGPDQRGRIELMYAGQKVLAGTPRCITNPLVEVGAISCRVMLEFLGIKVGKDELIEVSKRKSDDIAIEMFGVPRVRLADLDSYAGTERELVRLSCVTTIHIAHKVVAHFTSAPIERTGFEHLLRCGRTVVELIERDLYGALGREVPDYRYWPAVAPPHH